MNKVFVYGSLKKGYWNNTILSESNLVGEGIIKGFDIFSLGAFPAIKPHYDQDNFVAGELYEVDDATLQRLDWLEGNGSFYQREQVLVKCEDESEHMAWVYVLLSGCSSRQDIYEEQYSYGVVRTWNSENRDV